MWNNNSALYTQGSAPLQLQDPDAKKKEKEKVQSTKMQQ